MDDMQKLPKTVRNMRHLFDDEFIAYINHAVDKERQRIRNEDNLDPDREPSTWLQVLSILRTGVYAELAKGLKDDIQAVSYVFRMPDAETQRLLLETTINKLPTIYIRQFHEVATNIADNLLVRADKGELDEKLEAKARQFALDLVELLPPVSEGWFL